MATYRCYLLDASGGIVRAEDLPVNNDADAKEMAASLAVSPGYHGFEVWDADRRVHVGKRQRGDEWS